MIAAGLVVPEDLDFLVGIYAFGAMLAFTIAHLSICRLRYSEPERDRPYRIPLSINVRGGELPLPAVFGALLSGAGWVAVMILHDPARYVGLGWMLAGLALYVVYRRADETSLLRRVTVSPEVLRAEPPRERDYGSILVPLFGTRLDEDIVQTAALLVSGEPTDEAAIDAATIEAVWIFVIPMSLPLDARLPEAQVKQARQALARAKAVGEEYTGVQVATATVRTRRAGYAIVDEARRRGVEAIVLGAEEPSLIRGGARLGGRGGPLENFVGDVTKYVIEQGRLPRDRDRAGRRRVGGGEPLAPGAGEPLRPSRTALRPSRHTFARSSHRLISAHVRPDRGSRARRLGRRQVGAGGRPRSVGARRGPALARAPGRGPDGQTGRTPTASSRSARRWRSTR